MSISEDSELLERCRAGDRSAFTEIYHRHRNGVFRVVGRMLVNQADQEEVAQEVFLQVFRSLKSFKGTAKLSTWIHRVAMNVVLQHLRKKKSRIRLYLDEDPQARASVGEGGTPTPEDRAVQLERRRAVARTLEGLSDKKRAAIVLHDFEGIPAKEIATIVGAPVLTVRTRIFYARREFYERLASEAAFADMPLAEKDEK